MERYEKPVVVLNGDVAEGVYTASGVNANLGCDSQYMKGVYQAPKYGWNTTVIEYYGCLGCPAYTYGGCALDPSNHFDESGNAASYDTDNGTRMPAWEALGIAYDREINNQNPQPY